MQQFSVCVWINNSSNVTECDSTVSCVIQLSVGKKFVILSQWLISLVLLVSYLSMFFITFCYEMFFLSCLSTPNLAVIPLRVCSSIMEKKSDSQCLFITGPSLIPLLFFDGEDMSASPCSFIGSAHWLNMEITSLFPSYQNSSFTLGTQWKDGALDTELTGVGHQIPITEC